MENNNALLQQLTNAQQQNILEKFGEEETMETLQTANAALSMEILQLNANLLLVKGEVETLKLKLKKANADGIEALRTHLLEIEEIKKAFEAYKSIKNSEIWLHADEVADTDDSDDSVDVEINDDNPSSSSSSIDSTHPLLRDNPPKDWLNPTITAQPTAPIDHCILM